MKHKLLLAIGTALAIAGCQSGTPTPVTDQSGPSTTTGSTPSTALNPVKTPAPPDKPASPALVVPDSLKTDAYHYFGLGNDKPMSITISSDVAVPGAHIPATGTQKITVKSLENGKATFDIDRDGELAENYGSETVSLEGDGLYTIKSAQISDKVRNLELPSKLPVGATWKNSGKYNVGKPTEIAQDQTFKVIGEQKITTPVGPETALLITSSGTLTIQGKKSRMTSSLWYVKDKGLVKSELQVWDASNPKAKPRTITIQESK